MRSRLDLAIPRSVCLTSALVSAAIGMVALLGWFTHTPALQSIFPGFVCMKFNTALGLIVSAMALIGLWSCDSSLRADHRFGRAMVFLLSALVILNGASVLIEYATGADLHVDQLFWNQAPDEPTAFFPGRMSPVVALNFICLGIAFLVLCFRRRQWIAQFAGLLCLFSALAAITGYFYGARVLYAAGHSTAVALNSGVALLCVSIGTLCLQPERGLVRMLASPGLDGLVARRFVPAAVLIPFVIGWIRLQAQYRGLIDTETGLALFCLANIILFLALIWWSTHHLVQAEKAFHESTRRYVFLADSMPQIMWTATPDGSLDYYNKRWYDYAGMTFGQTKDGGFRAVVHPDDLQRCLDLWTRSITTGENYEVEYRFKRASDGIYRWHLGRASPFRDEHNRIIQWVGTCTDIENQKQARAQLEQRVNDRTAELAGAKTRLQAILDAATRVSVIATDTKGTITLFNAGSEAMLGYAAEELVGKQTPALLHVEAEMAARALELSALCGRPIEGFDIFCELPRQGKTEEREWTYVCKDGRKIPVTLVVTATRDRHGQIDGFLGVAIDASERKRAEATLLAGKETAEAANRAKSEFLANMSHEIRTPMNGIIGMTALALETDLSRSQREYLEMVKHSADSLLSLINDILDFSKIEAGKLSLETIPFDLKPALGKTLRALAIRAERKGVELTSELDADIPDVLIGDPGRLRQIILNLIDNAIKFTDAGEVNFRVRLVAAREDEISLAFSVRDTGIGIATEKQEIIFAAFAQADGSTTRNYGGTGLGLAISARLVEQMGGTLAVESRPDQGSVFHFTITLGRPARATPPAEKVAPNFHRLRVLVVDDNDNDRRILQAILSNWQMVPSGVASGAEAMAALESATASAAPFQLVVLDALMPETDGFSLAERISHSPSIAACPMIMLSSGLSEDEIARWEALGTSAYITKPVTQSELLEAIAKTCVGSLDDKPVTSLNRPAMLALRILIADDNPINQSVARGILEKQGHLITVCGNGAEAVELFEREPFDLILMDVQMPELDGFGATERIRRIEQGQGRRLPIVAMTAHAMSGDRERCLAAGMDGYIAKPIERQHLLEIVDEFGAGVVRPRPSTSDSGPAELLGKFDGDVALLQRISAIFAEQTPGMLANLEHALQTEDATILRQTAHTLVGSFGALGAEKAMTCARELEVLGETCSFAPAKQVLNQLKSEVDSIQSRLAVACR